MSFEACESNNLIHSVPFPRLGISGALRLLMPYLIVFQLFRLELMDALMSVRTVEQLNSSILRGVLFFIIYITIYISISYITI